MEQSDFRFPKEERLCRRSYVRALFNRKRKHPKSFRHPILAVWMPWDQPDAPSVRVQLLISVSKKNWKRAVDRNRIKRLIREAYRQQKYILKQCLPPEHPGIALLLMFTAHTLPDYHSLKGCVEKILHDIGRREGRKP